MAKSLVATPWPWLTIISLYSGRIVRIRAEQSSSVATYWPCVSYYLSSHRTLMKRRGKGNSGRIDSKFFWRKMNPAIRAEQSSSLATCVLLSEGKYAKRM